MSTNPNNAVGTNAAYSGRTSVNAFNDDLAAYGRGILSGWACSPSTGLKVQLGGISGAPIEMTISAAPSTNSRIDAIVAYVDNPAEGVSTVADNPAACGMIVVKGTAAASPVEPNETMIRSAITADGASGVTAYYAVLATVKIASGTTDLTSANIFRGPSAGIGAQNIDFTTFPGPLITLSSTYQIKYIKAGNIVNVQMSWGSRTVSDGTQLATLPEGYRPLFDLSERNGFDNQKGEIIIQADGKILYSSNTGNSDYVRANFCFIAA